VVAVRFPASAIAPYSFLPSDLTFERIKNNCKSKTNGIDY